MSNSSISAHGILEGIWDLRDRRVDEWPLMNSPLPTVALCCLYFYTVKFLGPWFMKERKPFDLKNTIIVYNFVQVAFSAWLFIKIYLAGWGTTYRDARESLICLPNHSYLNTYLSTVQGGPSARGPGLG